MSEQMKNKKSLWRKITDFFETEKSRRIADDFQPDAICLENQSPGFPMHVVWYTLLVLLALGIVWASLVEVDKVVVAEGKIVTTRAPLTIKPLERTVIKKVHVTSGQRVKEGDILFTFDPTITMSDLRRLEEQFVSTEAQRRRLAAENNSEGFEINPAEDKSGDLKLQKMLFDARKGFYDEKMRGYNENIARIGSSVSSLEKSKVRYDGRQDKVRQVENMLKDLAEKKVVSIKELLETQISVIGMEVQIDQLEMQVMEYMHQLMIMQAERNSFSTDWKRQLVEELVKVDRECMSLEREITKAKMLVSMVELKAPCDAVVHELAPFQEGSAVREAESLITLIPLDVPLEAEVNVLAKDVGQVRVGDDARIKFDAYPFQQHGTLQGKVRYISEDAFEKNGDGAQSNPRQAAERKGSFYQVRLVIGGSFNNPQDKIIPGMRIVAEVKVGKRRVISYLVNPFVKALDEAIREP